jgi:hypothetical protein
MDEDALLSYTSDLFGLGGDIPELCYLTPRILECYVESAPMFNNPWDVILRPLGRLFHKGQWWEWDKPLADALHAFFTLLWQLEVCQVRFPQDQEAYLKDRQEYRLMEWVCFLGNALPDFSALLPDLLNNPKALEIIYNANEPDSYWWGCLCDSYGTDWHANHQRLTDFLNSPEVEDVLLQMWI